MKPVASVAIGVFNRARQIIPCLDSLLASTEQNFQIVLVEDASSDNTREVLERYVREHPDRNIKLIINEKNRGASGSRNVGIDAADGDFVLFTDSDCIVEPTWIEEMVKTFRTTGAAAISGRVTDKPPTNLAERQYIGSCLVTAKEPNLMESNMGLRRDLGFHFDDVLFGGEGDDLAKRLRAHGHSTALAPDAAVCHHHALDLKKYFRMIYIMSRGHTFYWYKHGLVIGKDIAAMAACFLSLPLGLFGAKLLLVPAAFFCLQVLAILFNEMRYKGKPLGEALAVLPVAIPIYILRTAVSLRTLFRIMIGAEPAIRASKKAWLRELAGLKP